MQEELNRIKNKDYTHIDQKLYTNLGMTGELDTTLAQLAELQKYLKSQIDSIQDQGQKEIAMRASQVIMDISTIRQNKKNDYKQQARYSKKYKNQIDIKTIFKNILYKIHKISKSFKNIKQSINNQFKYCIQDLNSILKQNIQKFSRTLVKNSSQVTKLKIQLSVCVKKSQQLQQKNIELLNKLSNWQLAQHRLKQRRQKNNHIRFQNNNVNPINNNLNLLHIKQVQNKFTSTANYNYSGRHKFDYLNEQTYISYGMGSCTDRYQQNEGNKQNTIKQKQFKSLHTINSQFDNETPRLPMPLRRDSSIKKMNQLEQKFRSCQNTVSQYSSNATIFRTAKNSPKRDNSSKHSSKPTSPTCKLQQKQNQILKLKGMNEPNKKPTKKLKLFSLI